MTSAKTNQLHPMERLMGRSRVFFNVGHHMHVSAVCSLTVTGSLLDPKTCWFAIALRLHCCGPMICFAYGTAPAEVEQCAPATRGLFEQ